MRLCELKKRKHQEPYDSYKAAYDELMYLKERGMTVAPNGTHQLFVPRKLDWQP